MQHALWTHREPTEAARLAALDGIAILDADRRFLHMNAAHAEYYGYDNPQELIGRAWQDLYDQEQVHSFENTAFAEVADDRSSVFHAFFSNKPRGLGLGLAISKSIIRAHGGELQLMSHNEGGTPFCFSLAVHHERTDKRGRLNQ